MITKISKNNLKIKLPEFKLGKVWIAGGCIRDSLVNEPISDIDIFGTKEDLTLFIAENLQDYKLTFNNEFISNYYKGDLKVQIVYRNNYQNIEQCLDSFDYTICMFAFDGADIWCESNALVHLFEKRIVIHKLNPEFVINSLERLQKYIKKGYTICGGGIKEIVTAVRGATQEQVDNSFKFYPGGGLRILKFD